MTWMAATIEDEKILLRRSRWDEATISQIKPAKVSTGSRKTLALVLEPKRVKVNRRATTEGLVCTESAQRWVRYSLKAIHKINEGRMLQLFMSSNTRITLWLFWWKPVYLCCSKQYFRCNRIGIEVESICLGYATQYISTTCGGQHWTNQCLSLLCKSVTTSPIPEGRKDASYRVFRSCGSGQDRAVHLTFTMGCKVYWWVSLKTTQKLGHLQEKVFCEKN